MAKQIITRITDDLDGSSADETVRFALDGNGYEIDLNSRNAKELRTFLERYMEAGTRTGRIGQGAQLQRHSPQRSAVVSARGNREQNSDIREWAERNGYNVAERGRIPHEVQQAYFDNRPNPRATAPALDDDEDVLEEIEQPPPAAKPAKTAPAVSFKPEKTSTPSRRRASTAAK